jgi:hypothetical protein
MIGIPIILVALIIGLILIGVLLAIFLLKSKSKLKTNEEPDYRVFFIMGISFLPMGIIFTAVISPGFMGITGMGLIYMAIGLANRHKWKKQNV